MGWEFSEFNLDELGFLGRGKSKHRPRNDSSLYGGEYPFIQTGDVRAANLYLNSFEQTYNDKGLAQSKLWDKETLIITIAANIAETAVLKIDACFPDSIVGFIPNEDLVDVYFVKYYIDYIKLEMQSISQGTTQDNLSLDKLRTFKFKVPKDRAIVSKISSTLLNYDNLIENNSRRIAILEEMAQSLYREWFVNFRYPGHADDTKNSESADENCDAVTGKNSNKPTLIDSPLGPIPEGWEVKNAIEIFNINIGKTPPRKQSQWFSSKEYGVKWVSIKDMGNNQIFVLETKECLVDEAIDKFKVKVIPADTVVMSFKLTVGKVAITSENMCTNEAIAHFNIKDNSVICREYIYLYLKGFAFQTLGNTSSIGNAINSQIVKSMPIVLPTSKIMDSFSELVSPIFANLLTLAKRNRNLKKQRDMLLPKLISGQIELKD